MYSPPLLPPPPPCRLGIARVIFILVRVFVLYHFLICLYNVLVAGSSGGGRLDGGDDDDGGDDNDDGVDDAGDSDGCIFGQLDVHEGWLPWLYLDGNDDVDSHADVEMSLLFC